VTTNGPGKSPYPHLGEVVFATDVIDATLDARRTRTIILLLAFSVGLMMTGFGIIMPVFARRLGELGSGVEALGLMTMSFALAQFVSAPIMGGFADRYGRRPIILLGLGAFALMNIGFLLVRSTAGFIAVRTLEGALSAGLFPAAMGVVADIVPESQRAKWVGFVMGSYGVGFIFGPTIGGVLFDTWGFAAPFIASAVTATCAFVAAVSLVPETRTAAVRRRERLRARRAAETASATEKSIWDALPKPLYIFGTLLLVDFVNVFAFAFVEPQMVFYFYEELNWSTVRFGVVVGVYGLAMVLSQTLLGQTSDKFGRRSVILVGLLLSASFYFALAFSTQFALTFVVAAVSGIGSGLNMPAMSAFYLDITASQHRSRVMGVKESVAALGGVMGPLLVVGFSTLMSPQGVFLSAGILTAVTVLVSAVLLREPKHVPEEVGDVALASARRRALSAQASLRGVVLRAREAREARVLA
jgi:DHA1 family tetracycline resistance protein-like MFS transporter